MFLRASTLTLETTWRLLRTASCALQPQPWLHAPGTALISTCATAAASGLKSESGTALRFYKHASVVQLAEVCERGRPPHHPPLALIPTQGFGVSLDGKMVRTPARAVLVAPTHALAVAIAAEWEYQGKTLIRPFTMPLMALTSTAIDQVCTLPFAVLAHVHVYN